MKGPIGFQDLRRGMTATVIECAPSGEFSTRLLELGLTPGTKFTVTKIAPFGDPVEITVRGTRLCLRRKEARGIKVTLE